MLLDQSIFAITIILSVCIAKTTWLSENAQFWTTNNFVWGHRNSRKFTCGVLIQSVFLCRPCETTYFIPSRDVITKFILFPNFERFPKNICDGYGLPTGDACSSRIPVPFHFGLVLLVENNSFPELVVIIPDFTLRTSLGTFSILLQCIE